MANVKFNKKTFEKEIGKLDEEMQHKITMFGTPVEAVTNEEVEIEIFPNRPDLLSYWGFKRSFLTYLGKTNGLKNYKLSKPEKDYTMIIDSSLKNIRPYTTCAIVKGLKLDDEKIKDLIDMQEKIHTTLGRKRKKVAIGIYPLDKITLPITFKAMEPDKIKFIPLDSEKEMSGLEILEKHPTGKEYAHLLAGKEKFPIFIDAENQILSMPPIINSHTTGKITEETKDVFVECSGSDFEILKKSLNILITAMDDMGGKVYQMELKYDKKTEVTPDLKPSEMKVSVGNLNKLLGLDLNEKQVKNFLEKMGHDYSKGNVEIGAWRTDILHEVDLIREVAIAFGFDKFIPEIPEISTIGEENGKETIKRKISEILSGLGFVEVSNYHLTNKNNQFEKLGVQERDFIEVEESKTDYNILRKDLTHFLMKNLSENIDAEYPQKIFEIGRVFMEKHEITEKENLALAISPGDFTQAKQIINYLFRMIGLKVEIEETDKEPSYFVDGRVGKIVFDKEEIGFIGEMHPRVLRNWKIRMPVALLEIDLEKIFEKLIN
jgi:phenylalanyl-tRNA synthetase beta chain